MVANPELCCHSVVLCMVNTPMASPGCTSSKPLRWAKWKNVGESVPTALNCLCCCLVASHQPLCVYVARPGGWMRLVQQQSLSRSYSCMGRAFMCNFFDGRANHPSPRRLSTGKKKESSKRLYGSFCLQTVGGCAPPPRWLWVSAVSQNHILTIARHQLLRGAFTNWNPDVARALEITLWPCAPHLKHGGILALEQQSCF